MEKMLIKDGAVVAVKSIKKDRLFSDGKVTCYMIEVVVADKIPAYLKKELGLEYKSLIQAQSVAKKLLKTITK